MKKQMLRRERGITLIALIITVIILVILVAVSIRAVTNMGIVGHAKSGTQKYAQKAVEENQMYGNTGNLVDSTLGRLQEISGDNSNSEESPSEPEEEQYVPITIGNILPEGATYKRGNTTYNAGDTLPETVNSGDILTYGDYEYKYNNYYGGSSWTGATTQNGWGVHVVNTRKTSYGEILSSINGKPVNTLHCTFYNCTALTTAPTIPNCAINMRSTFMGCTALTTVSTIPSSVTNMYQTFYGCTSLTGTIEINANPTTYTNCLKNTQITAITGTTTLKDEILATK